MRILHVLDHSLPLHSGYAFRTVAILREQRALGWETLQLTTPRHGVMRGGVEDAEGWRFHRTPFDRDAGIRAGGAVYAREMAATARRIDGLVGEFRPDIIHAHSPVLNVLPALWVGRRRGLPVVYEVRALWEDAAVDHGSTREGSVRYRASRALETFALRRAGALTTICEGLRREIAARGIPEARITVIPNAVDTGAFRFGAAPDPALAASLGLTGKTVVGFAGSFYGYEGLDLLIDALAILAPRLPDLRVLLVGGGMQETALREQARARGVADRVVFSGRVPHKEVQPYYDLIDVLAYPRHRMRLTEIVTPLKPLEAMAQGRMLVASDVGGHRELICDGETGVLFPAGDVGALADAIEAVLSRRDDWPRFRERARHFVETERTWARSVARYRPVYESLAGVGRVAVSRAAWDNAMCGIYGILRFDGAPVAPDALAPMARVTVHRGPDDEGVHVDGPCALGMRRLSIIDLAGGHQPLSNADGTLWLVANGEIYNFRGLRRDLEARGHRFKTGSDCETILHLYAEHGDDFVSHLNGMYAFALWDARRRRLLIGRDRLGVKPLYVHADRKRLAFASEAKALLALPGVRAQLDPDALDSYLNLGYVPAPQSIFTGIEKLPPATLLVAEGGKATRQRYWRVPAAIDRELAETEWAGRVRARLDEAVRMQMVSDVPIGAFLSGGIDSSTVVGLMSKHSDHPVRTYAIGFSGGGAESLYNELPYARQVAQRFRTEHREILVKPDVVGLLPRLVWHMDEPIADTAFLTTYLVSEFARREVTVILSGVGGDELFGGYRRYLGNHYQAHFERLPAWLRRTLITAGDRLPSDRHSRVLNLLRLTKGFLTSADLPFEDRYRSYVEVFPRDATRRLRRLNGTARRDAIEEAFRHATSDDALNRMLAVDAETQLPDDLLLLTDKMSMAVSLECRVPLLDHELVELAARMPESVKIRGGELKHALKAAVADLLPREILDRKKRGFGAPMGAWLRDELAAVTRELLSPRAVAVRDLFDPAEVSALIAAHEASRVDGTDRLLSLLNLEVWCRIFLDGQAPADLATQLKELAGRGQPARATA